MEGKGVLRLEVEQADLGTMGGKGANLARLIQAGFPVPGGFVVSTGAYYAYVAENNLGDDILRLARAARPDDPPSLEEASAAIRARFSEGTISPGLVGEVRSAYADLGRCPVAVRSSATAEDLPDMSFAGQQESYLNVTGEDELLRSIVNCWSSLWTARAIGYRAHNGIAPEGVALAVIVQCMVESKASGVLFTANPLNGKREEVVIDATLGLGEALVSGQVEPDHYIVNARDGRIINKKLGSKALEIHGQPGGGTTTVISSAEVTAQQALPDTAIADLARLGLRVARFYGEPQDIEWAWSGGELFLVQARPITSLYPLPAGATPEPLHVYLSLALVQGVLDPFTPLGQDNIRLLGTGVGRMLGYQVTMESLPAVRPAGERLFLDITALLRHPLGRRAFGGFLRMLDESTRAVVQDLLRDPRLALYCGRNRGDLVVHLVRGLGRVVPGVLVNLVAPSARYRYLHRRSEVQIARLVARVRRTTTLGERVDVFEETALQAFPRLRPYLLPGIISGMTSLFALQHLAGQIPGSGTLVLEATRGLPHNVTTEMDLALWQTAKSIRADSAAADLVLQTSAADLAALFLAGRLPKAAQDALASFLRRYGMRGIAEVDIGRPRWSEDPTPVVQAVQSYLRIESPNQAPDLQFERGRVAAESALSQLAVLAVHAPGGKVKARLVRFFGRRLRTFTGMRESPKFFLIRLFSVVRAGLLQSGQELVAAGVLDSADDLFYLHLPELRALAGGEVRDWRTLVAERRAVYAREVGRRQLPRLMLSDGETFYQGMSADAAPGDSLVGSPVSPGVVEGTVHVVLDPFKAELVPGEILVCPATDPGWTPLFLAAGGLVMEVGGLMTHGSVVAREYGIPAVVGVHDVTKLLHTGQRIRVDGSTGRIIVLETGPSSVSAPDVPAAGPATS